MSNGSAGRHQACFTDHRTYTEATSYYIDSRLWGSDSGCQHRSCLQGKFCVELKTLYRSGAVVRIVTAQKLDVRMDIVEAELTRVKLAAQEPGMESHSKKRIDYRSRRKHQIYCFAHRCGLQQLYGTTMKERQSLNAKLREVARKPTPGRKISLA